MYVSDIWYPCSQMKDYENFQPINIKSCKGSYLYCDNGDKIIDAISSWWCKSLGHNHDEITAALIAQIKQFEHVILANTVNEKILQLSEKLISLTPHLNHVLYASDGSCAIEMALKMSLHSRKIKGGNNKTQFISLANGYHGETCGALSISDVGIYKSAYQEMLFQCHHIEDMPYVTDINDPLWHDCSEHWNAIVKKLQPHAEKVTAIVVEPILQAAGGMRFYSKNFLYRLASWAKQNNIHLIADEIMTGFGRLGKNFAYEFAEITPDFVCIAKGLTAGYLPMSAMLTTSEMYQLFYDDYEKGNNFLHSHTHSGNVLAASVALKVLSILEQENIYQRAINIGDYMAKKMHVIAENTGKIQSVRQVGAVVAADLVTDDSQKRYGHKIYKKAVTLGALLRPLGNTIYWTPPLNITFETIDELAEITEKALLNVIKREMI